jgi:cytochrome P450
VAAVHQLHLKYGPVVRVAPNELAYTDAAAWKDIYGYRAGVPENIKEPSQAFSDDPRYPNILEAPQELHSKVRRMLSNAFSDKCIREQEPIISTYTDILIDRLRNREGPVDIMKWYTVSRSSPNDRG